MGDNTQTVSEYIRNAASLLMDKATEISSDIEKENPDGEYATEVREQLKENDGFCPCKLERTPDTRCMCKEFREQKEGICYCGLYIKEKD